MKNKICDFINYLEKELNYSKYTIKNYSISLSEFDIFLLENKLDYLHLTKDNVRGYLKKLDTKKYSNKTLSLKLSALRSFYEYLLNENYITTNIFKSISNPKVEKKLPNFLSYDDIDHIIHSLTEETILDLRNKCIIELLYATGIRVSELVNIKLSDINFSDMTIKVLGKGNKERIVYFGKYALNAIKKYEDAKQKKNTYLFLNNKGNKISIKGVQNIVNSIALKASLKNKISPHTFRHTFATHLLNNGADIKSVQELLGHSSLNTTEIYTHITPEYLRREYLKSMPRK